MTVRHPLARPAALAVALSTALALSACGSDSLSSDGGDTPAPATDTGEVQVDEELAALVPADIREAGTILVGSDASYAPLEFIDTDGSTVIGMDVDLFTAAAQVLDLDVEFQNAGFDSIITGVTSGRYDAGVSAFTINPERTAQALMVSYFDAGTQWAVASGNPEGIDPDDACGLTVGVQAGTVQVDDVTARSEACVEAGEEPIDIQQLDGQDQVTARLVSGQVAAMLADSPVAAYAVEQSGGEVELAGDIYDSAPYGVVLAPDQADFAEAIAGAYAQLIEDGTYDAVLAEWGNEAGAVDEPTVNP